MTALHFRHVPVLMVLLAAPLAAQVQVPSYRIDGTRPELQVEVSYPTPTTHFLFVGQHGKTVSVGRGELLAEPFMFRWAFDSTTAKFDMPFSAELAARHGFHLQDVVFAPDLINGPVIAAATAFVPTVFGRGNVTGNLRNVSMRIERSTVADLGQGGSSFVAEFQATSDGWGLHIASVIRHADVTDIYLLLETPGPGEGLLDIAQTLRVEVPLGPNPGNRVCVFAAEGPDPLRMNLSHLMPCISLDPQQAGTGDADRAIDPSADALDRAPDPSADALDRAPDPNAGTVDRAPAPTADQLDRAPNAPTAQVRNTVPAAPLAVRK